MKGAGSIDPKKFLIKVICGAREYDQMKDHVLVVFPSTFSIKKLSNLQSAIKNAIEENNIEHGEIFLDDSLIIVEVDDPVTVAPIVADLLGVDKVAVADRTGNKFNDIVAAIVNVGKKIINSGETFAVTVHADKTEYVGRDAEFAATAALIGELSRLNVKAVAQQLCDKLIHAHATQNSTYICMFIDKGLNGLPAGSQTDQLLCSLHDSLSTLSCLMAIKCGFVPKIVVLKTNNHNVKECAEHLELIAKRLGKKHIKLDITSFDISGNGSRPLVIEKLSSLILTNLSANCNIKNIALPLSTAIFPSWFVSEIVGDISKVAVPWLPLMFMSDELYMTAGALGMKDSAINAIQSINGTNFDADEYAQFMKAINLREIVDRSIKSMKTVDLEIGPNCLHDIIDSMTV